MGDPVRLVDVDPSRAATFGELVAESALAGPRIAGHTDDLRVSRHRFLERRFEGFHLALPADELREAARARHLELRSERSESLELVDPDRFLHSFDGELSEI